jgi:Sec-independent protein translocase protein TatA
VVVVALVTVGLKELPGAISQFGKWVRRRRVRYRSRLNDLMYQVERDGLQKETVVASGLRLDQVSLAKPMVAPCKVSDPDRPDHRARG